MVREEKDGFLVFYCGGSISRLFWALSLVLCDVCIHSSRALWKWEILMLVGR